MPWPRSREKPLWRLLSERFNGGQFDEKVLVYPGGGYYYPGKELEGLQGRDARLPGAKATRSSR